MSSKKSKCRLLLEELESRWVPDIGPGTVPAPPPNLLPISVPDSTAGLAATTPSNMQPLKDAVDPNPGGVIDYSTVIITTAPSNGRVQVDSNTGTFIFTPNSLLPPPGQPYPQLPVSFQFTVRDNLGAISNVATVTFTVVNGPGQPEPVIVTGKTALTMSLQPVTVGLLSTAYANFGGQIDPTSVSLLSSDPPKHGTATVDSASGTVTYTPELGYTGYDQFTYSVSDTFGFKGLGQLYIVIPDSNSPRLQADPLGGQMLVIDGTPNDDTILVTPGSQAGDVLVTVNGVTSGPFHPTGRIVTMSYGGNDFIRIDPRIQTTAWLLGGNGNDTLIAGSGPSILIGGAGSDALVAGSGRSLLIGGTGTDTTLGNANAFTIAGTTTLDNNTEALNAILTEWNSKAEPKPRPVCSREPFTPPAPVDLGSSPFDRDHRCGGFHAKTECEHRARPDCISGSRGRR